jgi:hypothetical protein
MMKKLALLPLAALAFAAACADTPTALQAPDGAAFTRDVSGPTWVNLVFSFEVLGGGAGLNKHPQGKGTCRNEAGVANPNPAQADPAYTFWYNQAGNRTNAPFCQDTTAGESVTCSVDPEQRVRATYAQNPTDKTNNLNFDIDQEANGGSDLYVHWRQQQNDTRGLGTLEFSYACADGSGGTATLDLAQFASAGTLFSAQDPWKQSGDRGLRTNNPEIWLNTTGHDDLRLQYIYWTYRERVGL